MGFAELCGFRILPALSEARVVLHPEYALTKHLKFSAVSAGRWVKERKMSRTVADQGDEVPIECAMDKQARKSDMLVFFVSLRDHYRKITEKIPLRSYNTGVSRRSRSFSPYNKTRC